jgi:hypothetical protein
VQEQVGRVLVDPVGAGPLQLFAAVAARQQADAERPGPPGGQQVPDRVADHDRVGDLGPEALGRGQEQVGVGLGVGDLVAGDHRDAGRDPEQLKGGPGRRLEAAGRDRPGHAGLGEAGQQLARPRQHPHLAGPAAVGLGVALLERGHQLGVDRLAGLAQQRADEQAAAHPHAPVDAPHRQLDPAPLQRLLPGQHVLVDAVDQGAVEIEDEHGPMHGPSLPSGR